MWPDGFFRAFLSYSGADDGYQLATKARESLAFWGISAFVDKDDIQKGSPWRTSLLEALNSTQIVIALLTPDFRTSDWADQEIGFAISRGIPAFPVNYGVQPYGFFGEFQEMDGEADWVTQLPQILLARPESQEQYLLSYTRAMRAVDSYDAGNRLAELLDLNQA